MTLIIIIKASLQRFCWLLVVGFQIRKMLDPEYDDTSESKRKKSYSRREILEKLEECENDVKRAVGEIVADISPFDVADSNVEDFEEKVEKLDKVSKVSFSTKQVMSVCFALREVSVSDGGNSVPVVWTSRLAGSNKPSNTRPLALFPAKEDVELLKEFIPIVEAEIKEMEDEGVLVEVTEEGSSSEARASCSKCSMSMVQFFCLSNSHRGKYFCTRSMAK